MIGNREWWWNYSRRENVRRETTVYQAYYRIRLVWAIAWRYVAMAAAVCVLLWVTGCAANRLDHEATAADRAACQQATGSYKGAMWAAAYRDCLLAKGYK